VYSLLRATRPFRDSVVHGERVLIQGRVPATGTLLDAGELLVVVQLAPSCQQSAKETRIWGFFQSLFWHDNNDLTRTNRREWLLLLKRECSYPHIRTARGKQQWSGVACWLLSHLRQSRLHVNNQLAELLPHSCTYSLFWEAFSRSLENYPVALPVICLRLPTWRNSFLEFAKFQVQI
jgi:hypothetical protein